MGFHNVAFPDGIAIGSTMGPSYRTLVVTGGNGAEYRTARQDRPLQRYDVIRAVEEPETIQALITFFHARKGQTYSFLLWDPYDHSTDSDHLTAPVAADTLTTLGTGDASETQFQLWKVYADAEGNSSKPITKPLSGTVVVKLDSTEQTEGVDYTVDYTTGIVTFSSAPGVGVAVTGGCQYYHHVRFETDWLRIEGDNHLASIRSIPMIEVRDAIEGPEMRDFGGADAAAALTADVALTKNSGVVQTYTPNANGHEVQLYDPEDAELGGPHFFITNESGSFSLSVTDPTNATTVATVAAGEAAEVWCRSSGGLRVWVAI